MYDKVLETKKIKLKPRIKLKQGGTRGNRGNRGRIGT